MCILVNIRQKVVEAEEQCDSTRYIHVIYLNSYSLYAYMYMYQQYKTRTVLLQMKDDCKPFSWTNFFLWIKLNGPHISSFNRLHYSRFFFQSMLVVKKHRKLNLQCNWKIRTGKRRIQLILILCKHSAIFVQFENISVGFFFPKVRKFSLVVFTASV